MLPVLLVSQRQGMRLTNVERWYERCLTERLMRELMKG